MRQVTKPENRVLLAGLRPLEAASASAALGAEGIRVDVVDDANAVLQAVQSRRPGGIVLDDGLAGISGSALCQVLRRRADTRHTPILLLVSAGNEDAILRAVDAGASDLLRRPLHGRLLARRIGTWVRLRQRESELARNRDLLRRLASVATWEVDTAGGEFEVSDGLLDLLGVGEGGPITITRLLDACLPDDRMRLAENFQHAAETGEAWSAECEIALPDGESRFVSWEAEVLSDERGQPSRITGSVQDVTERMRAAEQMRFLAYHDGLTGLANRNAFMERLQETLEIARRHGRSLGLLFLDLDNFKRVNDTLGHSVGDELLRAVARRLEQCLRTSDLVTWRGGGRGPISRLGGDEFTVVLPEIHNAADAGGIASRVLDALREPFPVGPHELVVGVSIGITLFPGDGDDVETLLRNADVAMYEAKARGRNNFQFFSQEIGNSETRRVALEDRLRGAIERRDFELFYQPQVEIRTGRILGVEALIRWTDADLGPVPPAEFIPVAESCGLINPIGEWVLEEACSQSAAWLAQGMPPLHMAVNISPQHFESDALLEQVGQVLFDTGMPPNHLVVEITENVFSADPDAVRRTLRELKRLGIQVALDDFGTGYSSLSYLKRFPVDILKIDRSFVRDVVLDADDAAITEAIVSMARALRLQVVAEGVETEKQRSHLDAIGCRVMQGYLFSPPVPPAEIEQMLRAAADSGLETSD